MGNIASDNAIVFFISMFVSAAMMPFLIRVAANYNLEDRPDERKRHEKPISSLGGMGIFLGMWAAILFVDVFQIHILPKVVFQLYALSSIMIILGILDDILNIKPEKKLFAQFFVAVLAVFWLHNDIIKLFNLIYTYFPYLPYICIFGSIFWIVYIINGSNFLDGLDGLWGGVAFIIFSGLYYFTLIWNQPNYALIVVAMMGAILGFLIYNFYPAKIFMGNNGSLFVGFMIGVMSFLVFRTSLNYLFVILLLFAYPMGDVIVVAIHRFNHKLSIFKADRNHFHYKMLGDSKDHRKPVLFIYMMNVLFVLSAIYLYYHYTIVNITISTLLYICWLLFAYYYRKKRGEK